MTIPLESMASNVPVIATPVGGNKEYLKHEKNCLLFYPGNANDLANCISRLIYDDELYNHIQKVGFQLVEKDYTINKIIPKIEKYIIDAKINFFNSC
jgi:glycosyltransferase involved in cell wall biosynthesis